MSKFRFTIKVLGLAIFMFASVSIAQAQASRTWVSGVGDDVNPCSRTAPCKTFAGAISKTAAAGEISVLDPLVERITAWEREPHRFREDVVEARAEFEVLLTQKTADSQRFFALFGQAR